MPPTFCLDDWIKICPVAEASELLVCLPPLAGLAWKESSLESTSEKDLERCKALLSRLKNSTQSINDGEK